MGLQSMARPFDKHLDEQELDALVPSSSQTRQARRGLLRLAVHEAERHVESCASCACRLEQYRQLVHPTAGGLASESGTRETDCPTGQDVDWYEVAAGLWPQGKASQLIAHAALCDHCGPLLRAATSIADDEPSPEEQGFLAELKAPSRPAVNSMPGAIRPSPLSAFSWQRLLQFKVLVPALALLVLVSVFARRSPSFQSPLSGPQFAEFAVDAHRKHAQGTLALDVRSESPQAVNDWFQSKSQSLALPTSPVDPGEQRPYRLEGARLIRVGNTTAAYVAYRMHSGLVSLIVAPDSVAVASGGVQVSFAKVNFHYATVQGHKAVTWSTHGLTYALISQEGNRTQASCMVCHSAMKDRELTHTPTPLPVDRSVVQPVWQ